MEDNTILKKVTINAIFNEFFHLLIDTMPYDFPGTKLSWDFNPYKPYLRMEISLMDNTIVIIGETKSEDKIVADKVKICFKKYCTDDKVIMEIAQFVQDFQKLLDQLAVDFNACQNKFKNAI